MAQLNNSSYYRANPYFQQAYLPSSAFQNRLPPEHLGQLPQGQQFFDPTNKKHFQRVGYQSTIQQQRILHTDPQQLEVGFFRSLHTQDIEGAVPNTLISQAVKNRMKAQQQTAQWEEKQRRQKDRVARIKMEEMEGERMRKLALQKMKIGGPNYHQVVKQMRTEQSQEARSPKIEQKGGVNRQIIRNHQQIQRQPEDKDDEMQERHILTREGKAIEQEREKQYQKYLSEQRQTNKEQTRPNKQKMTSEKYEQYTNQLEETEREIRDLERQLREANNFNDRGPQIRPRSNSMKIRNQIYTNQRQNPAYEATYPHEIRQKISQTNQSDQYQSQSSSHKPNIQFSQDYQSNSNYKLNTNINQLNHNSKTNLAQHQHSLHDNLNPQPSNYPSDSRLLIGKQGRMQHRLNNPTFLSYGSASIGMAGRNIVGY